MGASFNASGLGGRPAIVPGTDARLAKASIVTREPSRARRVEEYPLPGVSGRGTRDYGLEAMDIVWDIIIEAVSWSALQAFEALFAAYPAGERYRLVSELDDSICWDYVEFRRYEPLELHALVGESPAHILRVARVTWRWMQPS